MRTAPALLRSACARGALAHAPSAIVERARSAARGGRGRLAPLTEEGASESGITLIEVIASALIVGMITVGTLTGFVSAGRASANVRQHSQALLLAAQDEERLRGTNVTELGRLGTSTKTTTENGTVYTIESQAQFVSAAKEEFTCEASGTTADYIQTTSKVTWTSLGRTENGKRVLETLSQSSLIAVPTSTSLLVNVRNQYNAPVEGATVKESGKTQTAQQTTPASGCVIFGALADTEVNVTGTKAGWINEQREEEPAATEATLSSSSLVTDTFTIAAPGSIKAEFESAGSTAGVQGDTIYVSHTGLNEPVIAGTVGKYEAATLATKLFPFATPGSPPGESPYTVYAGDCTEDNPEVVASPNAIVGGKKEVTDHPAQVNAGEVTPVKVEVPAVNVTVYEGAGSSSPGSLDGKAEAKITNVSCGSTARTMKTTAAGALEFKYQPYAKKLKLCLTQLVGAQRYKYTTEFANTARAGISLPTVYMTATANKSSTGC
ncbi:MAG TPA: type II secretion system protein [Solirubrobacteraceae bacterium]|jgi:Tfp pilus assembly protein PilV|nr:type II secretion system protein [Solirubrobacteraceae bacterium]